MRNIENCLNFFVDLADESIYSSHFNLNSGQINRKKSFLKRTNKAYQKSASAPQDEEKYDFMSRSNTSNSGKLASSSYNNDVMTLEKISSLQEGSVYSNKELDKFNNTPSP